MTQEATHARTCARTARRALPERSRRPRWEPAQPRRRLPRRSANQARVTLPWAPQHQALELWDLRDLGD